MDGEAETVVVALEDCESGEERGSSGWSWRARRRARGLPTTASEYLMGLARIKSVLSWVPEAARALRAEVTCRMNLLRAADERFWFGVRLVIKKDN